MTDSLIWNCFCVEGSAASARRIGELQKLISSHLKEIKRCSSLEVGVAINQFILERLIKAESDGIKTGSSATKSLACYTQAKKRSSSPTLSRRVRPGSFGSLFGFWNILGAQAIGKGSSHSCRDKRNFRRSSKDGPRIDLEICHSRDLTLRERKISLLSHVQFLRAFHNGLFAKNRQF